LTKLSHDEYKAIHVAFLAPAEFRANDTELNFLDVKYHAVRADDVSIYAKNEKTGLIIAKTNMHYIFAAYDSSMYASIAVEAVERLAEYFRKKNK
jgi:profilin